MSTQQPCASILSSSYSHLVDSRASSVTGLAGM